MHAIALLSILTGATVAGAAADGAKSVRERALLRAYRPDLGYSADAGYRAGARYAPDRGYRARARYDADAHFAPTRQFRARRGLVVRGPSEPLSGDAGWFAKTPPEHKDRPTVLAALARAERERQRKAEAARRATADANATSLQPAPAAAARRAQAALDRWRAAIRRSAGFATDTRERALAEREAAGLETLALRSLAAALQLLGRADAGSHAPDLARRLQHERDRIALERDRLRRAS